MRLKPAVRNASTVRGVSPTSAKLRLEKKCDDLSAVRTAVEKQRITARGRLGAAKSAIGACYRTPLLPVMKSATANTGLSRKWEVAREHVGVYSGGKVQIASDSRFMACLCNGDVSFVKLDDGSLLHRLQGAAKARRACARRP